MKLDELIEKHGIEEISKKTFISIENLLKLKNRDFKDFHHPKVLGMLSILEKTYDIDILDSRKILDKQEMKELEVNKKVSFKAIFFDKLKLLLALFTMMTFIPFIFWLSLNSLNTIKCEYIVANLTTIIIMYIGLFFIFIFGTKAEKKNGITLTFVSVIPFFLFYYINLTNEKTIIHNITDNKSDLKTVVLIIDKFNNLYEQYDTDKKMYNNELNEKIKQLLKIAKNINLHNKNKKSLLSQVIEFLRNYELKKYPYSLDKYIFSEKRVCYRDIEAIYYVTHQYSLYRKRNKNLKE